VIDKAFDLLGKMMTAMEEGMILAVKALAKSALWLLALILVFWIVSPSLERASDEVPGDLTPSDPAIFGLGLSIFIVALAASLRSRWLPTAAKWLRLSAMGFVTVWGVFASLSSSNGATTPVMLPVCAILLGGAYYLLFEGRAKRQEDMHQRSIISDAVRPIIQEGISEASVGLRRIESGLSLLSADVHELRTELKSAKETEKTPESIPEQPPIATSSRCFRVLSWTIQITRGQTP